MTNISFIIGTLIGAYLVSSAFKFFYKKRFDGNRLILLSVGSSLIFSILLAGMGNAEGAFTERLLNLNFVSLIDQLMGHILLLLIVYAKIGFKNMKTS